MAAKATGKPVHRDAVGGMRLVGRRGSAVIQLGRQGKVKQADLQVAQQRELGSDAHSLLGQAGQVVVQLDERPVLAGAAMGDRGSSCGRVRVVGEDLQLVCGEPQYLPAPGHRLRVKGRQIGVDTVLVAGPGRLASQHGESPCPGIASAVFCGAVGDVGVPARHDQLEMIRAAEPQGTRTPHVVAALRERDPVLVAARQRAQRLSKHRGALALTGVGDAYTGRELVGAASDRDRDLLGVPDPGPVGPVPHVTPVLLGLRALAIDEPRHRGPRRVRAIRILRVGASRPARIDQPRVDRVRELLSERRDRIALLVRDNAQVARIVPQRSPSFRVVPVPRLAQRRHSSVAGVGSHEFPAQVLGVLKGHGNPRIRRYDEIVANSRRVCQ